MKENAVIFYFRTGGDAFSQNIERSLSIFSDSFVVHVYSCSCHVRGASCRISHPGEFDRLSCVRTYARIRTATVIFLTFLR